MLLDLQKALYETLSADAALMALVGGVYDHVPQGANFAYVVIGDDTATEFDDDREAGFDAEATIHTWGRAHRGRKEVKEIQREIYRVLHRNLLPVDNAHTVETFVEWTDSFLDADGITYHGVQRVRVVLTPLEGQSS
jgi:hypothetical protein